MSEEKPKERYKCAGGIVFNADGKVLLREVTGAYKGYTWTFSKGRISPGETAEECALREVLEETGVTARIVHQLEGVRSGLESETTYFIMVAVEESGSFDKETSQIRWCERAEAVELLLTIYHEEGRFRDLSLLHESMVRFETSLRPQWMGLSEWQGHLAKLVESMPRQGLVTPTVDGAWLYLRAGSAVARLGLVPLGERSNPMVPEIVLLRMGFDEADYQAVSWVMWFCHEESRRIMVDTLKQ